MKNVTLLILLFFGFLSNAQNSFIKNVKDYQYKQNLKFHDSKTSPLTAKDIKTFEALEFYKINKKYEVTATLVKEKDPVIFEMPTTTDRKPLYVKYGTLTFFIDGKQQTLNIYQNKDFGRAPQYKNYLFLPFADSTNGNGSYGGGRYVDVLTTDEKPDGTITINFNKSYNPYCAYNSAYSCPLIPKENTLTIPIEAGVKNYKKH